MIPNSSRSSWAVFTDEVKEADPELERLLREEEEIEHRTRHQNLTVRNCPICTEEIEQGMFDIQHFERYREGLRKRYRK